MSVHVSKCKGCRCKGDPCYLATSCTLTCLFECDTPHSVTLYWMSPCNLSLASRTEINTGHGASKTYRVTSLIIPTPVTNTHQLFPRLISPRTMARLLLLLRCDASEHLNIPPPIVIPASYLTYTSTIPASMIPNISVGQ